jgi:hypothetical protein
MYMAFEMLFVVSPRSVSTASESEVTHSPCTMPLQDTNYSIHQTKRKVQFMLPRANEFSFVNVIIIIFVLEVSDNLDDI